MVIQDFIIQCKNHLLVKSRFISTIKIVRLMPANRINAANYVAVDPIRDAYNLNGSEIQFQD